MKRILLALAMVAAMVVTSVSTPSTAEARPRGWYRGNRGYYSYGYRPYYYNRPYYSGYYRSYYPRYYGNYYGNSYYPRSYYRGYYPGYYGGYGYSSPGFGLSFGRGGVYFY